MFGNRNRALWSVEKRGIIDVPIDNVVYMWVHNESV